MFQQASADTMLVGSRAPPLWHWVELGFSFPWALLTGVGGDLQPVWGAAGIVEEVCPDGLPFFLPGLLEALSSLPVDVPRSQASLGPRPIGRHILEGQVLLHTSQAEPRFLLCGPAGMVGL